ncbi:MAG TPA: helix-turn-helix domain-containing protein [Rhodopila sp.]|nr:helix-turn-helix domain-containing protein [Rhodopila sp.]
MSVSLAIPARQASMGALSPIPWSSPDAPAFEMTGTVLRLTADRRLYAEGDEARCFYKVVSGTIRTCQFLSDGRRQIDAFHQPGDFFGFEVGADHRLAAEAVTDCTVIAYRRRGLETMLIEDDRLNRWFFSHAMTCMARAREHSLLLGRASAAQKVAAFLLEMADRGESDTAVELPMGRQDVADYLGLTIETVSRTLSHMEKDKVIALPSPRRVMLKDRRTLRELNI